MLISFNKSIWLSLIFLVGVAWGAAPEPPSELRVNYATNPLGIDTVRPLFSWIVNDKDRAEVQSAYQMIVASTEALCKEGKGDLWDSGKVQSTLQSNIQYEGKDLACQNRRWWAVRTWDKEGHPSPWSPPATFETALLEASDWKASWIGGDYERYRTETLLPANKTIAWARAHISAKGIFSLTINGKSAGGDRVLEPGVSMYSARMRYCTYDVTNHLQSGANAIGVALGRAHIGHWWLKSKDREFILQIEVCFTDGSKARIVSEKEHWKATKSGPIVPLPPQKSELYQGETYDARNEDGWATAGYDDHSWTPLSTAKPASAGAPLCAQTAPPMKAGELITPVGMTEPLPGIYVFDFGQKISGWSRLSVKGPRGKTVTLRHGEKLYTPQTWADYTLTLNVRIVQGAAGIRFRIADNDNAYMWQFNANGSLIPQKKVGGEWTVIKSVPAGLKTNTTYAVKIEAVGSTIKTTIDGKLIDVTEDTTFRSGKVGFHQHGSETATYDHIFVEPAAKIDLSRGGQYSIKNGFADEGLWRNREHLTVATDKSDPKNISYYYTITDNETFESYDGGITGLVDQSNLHVFGSRYFADSTDKYILKGEGEEVWEPTFTLHGFRYVELRGYPGVPTLDSVKGRPVHQAVDGNPGSFACSNELLNKLHNAFTWTFKNTLQFGMPVDCDQRDERMGWTGDAHCTSLPGNYNFDMVNFYDSWMSDLQDTQIENGAIYRTAPTQNIEEVRKQGKSTTWLSAYLNIPWDTYMASGSKAMLGKRYVSMKAFVDFLRTDQVDGYIDSKTSCANWATTKGGFTNEKLVTTAYLYHCVRLMAMIAAELNHEEDAKFYTAESESIQKAFNAKYLAGNKDYKGDGPKDQPTQTSNALALDLALCPASARADVVQSLVDTIQSNDWHLNTGVIGTKSLLNALSENGRNDIAYGLATQTTFPSWGNWIAAGLTSCCEFWDMRNSYGHAYLGGPLDAYFFTTLAGIAPTKPGYEEFRIKPYLLCPLKHLSATVNTVKGTVAVRWNKQGINRLTLDVTVPVNTKAAVYIPTLDINPAAAIITESGEVIWNHGIATGHVPGISAVRAEQKCIVMTVGSGSYQFSVKE